jgi:two-component sensor histidine kinase
MHLLILHFHRKASLLLCLALLLWVVPGPLWAQPAGELLTTALNALEKGDYSTATRGAEAALKQARQQRQPLLEAKALRLRARVHQARDEFSAGLPLLLRALRIFEQQRNIPEIVNTNLTLIEFYRADDNPEQGWQLYQRTRTYLQRGQMTGVQAARLFHRAAACAHESGRLDSVVALSEKSLRYSRPLGLASDMATSYNELGFYYTNRNQTEPALHYLRLAEEQALKLRHWPQVLNVLRNSMLLQISSGQLAEAESTMARMKAVPQNPPIFRQSHDFLLLQATLLGAQGRWQEAYQKLDSSHILKIELFTRQHTRELRELSTRYQTERANLLARQHEQQARDSRHERNLSLISTAVVALLLVLLGLAFVRLRQRNKRVEEQRQAIRQINGQLNQALHTQKSLYNELDHRVKNNLAVLSSLIYLQASNAPELVRDALRQTRSRIDSLVLLHQELLNPSVFERNEGLRAYVHRLLAELHATFKRPGLEVQQEIDCPPIPVSTALATSLGLVLNELVTNSYKHAFKNSSRGSIHTSVHAQPDGFLHLTYTDSGPGLPSLDQARAAGTLGLSIMELLVQQHQGSFQYEHREGHPYFYLTFRLEEPPEMV